MTHPEPNETPPGEPYPATLQYASVPQYARARTLVRLAGIFNLIMGGLNLAGGVFYIVMLVFMLKVFSHMPAGAATMGGPSSPPGPMGMPPEQVFKWMIGVMYGGGGMLSLLVGALGLIAGIGFLRRRRWVLGWGLAAAIACSCELWCSAMCLLPLACGVYTLVILCLSDVRAYLRLERDSVQQVVRRTWRPAKRD